jgi:hypothetical protein
MSAADDSGNSCGLALLANAGAFQNNLARSSTPALTRPGKRSNSQEAYSLVSKGHEKFGCWHPHGLQNQP